MNAPVIPRACVIGHPVAHSRSPLIHGFWLKQFGIAGEYTREDVRPEAFAGFVARLKDNGYVGANVTVPNKEAAFALAGRRTARATRMGAVNTLWFEGDVLCGDNTDGEGFFAHLSAEHPGWSARGARITILGAGGAARGIAHRLAEEEPSVLRFANRTADRAMAIIAELEAAGIRCRCEIADPAALGPALAATDLLINTTSLGMKGQPPLVLDPGPLPDTAIVADIVYAPLETGLLKAARARDLRTLDGLGMLLHQAAPGFERWFGRRPTVSAALRDVIVADLTASA